MKRVISILACLWLAASLHGEERQNLNIVFIGNSITQGVILDDPRHEAPPVKAAAYLRLQPGVGTVRYSNQGVSGSTTFDFLPDKGKLFPNVTQVADQFKDETWATLLFSVMLGTNDSACSGTNGAPVLQDCFASARLVQSEHLQRCPLYAGGIEPFAKLLPGIASLSKRLFHTVSGASLHGRHRRLRLF